MKVFDCFAFFNELDILDIRLNELNDIVDKFVLVESNTTYSGRPKEYNFEKNKHLFEKFLPKIEYVKIDSPKKLGVNMTDTNFESFNRDAWINENDQRNSCIFGLSEAKDGDIIMVSDLDEIPNSAFLKEVLKMDIVCPMVLIHQFFYYYLNCAIMNRNDLSKIGDWYGTVISTYNDFLNTTPQWLRDNIHNLVKFNGPGHMGWHYSFMGGAERVKNKIESFAHVEFNSKEYIDINNITKNIEKNKDIFNRSEYTYKIFDINDLEMPQYVKNNIEKFSYLIKGL